MSIERFATGKSFKFWSRFGAIEGTPGCRWRGFQVSAYQSAFWGRAKLVGLLGLVKGRASILPGGQVEPQESGSHVVPPRKVHAEYREAPSHLVRRLAVRGWEIRLPQSRRARPLSIFAPSLRQCSLPPLSPAGASLTLPPQEQLSKSKPNRSSQALRSSHTAIASTLPARR